MNRMSFQYLLLFLLLIAFIAFAGINYFQHLPSFSHHSSVALTGNVLRARLDFPLVNINSANLFELRALPGISSNIASDIIQTRSLKPFADISELVNINGLGPKRILTLSNLIYCGDLNE